MRLMLLLICAVALTVGCTDKELFRERNDIVAVWKHEAGVYSVSTMSGNRIIDNSFHKVPGSGEACFLEKPEIVADVPEGGNMWYEAIYYGGGRLGINARVTIHVRSIDDVGGAGWNHGKFGSGMTERVQ